MNILLVEDHEIFSQGLAHLVQNHFDNVEIYTAMHCDAALKILTEVEQIDLLIVDLGLPDIDGCAFLTLLDEHQIIVPTCILSGSEDIAKIQHALSHGVMGYIPKNWDAQQILSALERILAGEIIIPIEIEKKLSTYAALQRQLVLTRRQKDVLVLLKDGLSNSKISQLLNISEYTVKSHVSALLQLFEAKNRMECVENAKKLGAL